MDKIFFKYQITKRKKMKKTILASVISGLLFGGIIGQAQAIPLDLSGFAVIENQPGSVVENSGVVDFTENMVDCALY